MPVEYINSRAWLRRREGETAIQQMERIRQTCRWCGEYFGAGPRGVGRIEVRRHEMQHVKAEDA